MKLPLWRRRSREEELEEEIQSHLQMAIRDRVERGESAEEAESAARREFGNVGLIKDTAREMWGWAEVKLIFDDMRYGLRMLRKSPGWTVVMCAVLALGIGLTTAIFSLAYGILLRALPYPDPERVVALYLTNTVAAAAGYSHFSVNAPSWIEWRAQSRSFEDIAITKSAVNFNLTGDGLPERVQGARSSWNLPRTLGVQPLVGRVFTEEEALRDAKVVALSYGFWDRRYARDPAIVGRKIFLSDESFEVIGVMPPNFRYPTSDLDLLAPLFIPPDEIQTFGHFYYGAVGRLKPGVSLQQAQAELSAISERLARQRPHGPDAGQDGAWVESLLDSYVGEFRTTLYVLLAAAGCLLLICCVNLGGLLIVRANARKREFAVRAALGASAARLRIQTLAEALPLSLAGAGAGSLLAWLLLKVLVNRLPLQLPGLETIGLHAPALAFALALSVLVVLLAGMLPARLASRAHLAATMQQDSRAVASGGRVRNALVAAQIAVTLALVFAGGLLAASLVAVLRVNPGFSPQGVLTMGMQAPQAKYPTEPQIADYYQRLAARVKTIPGVIEAGVAGLPPFGWGYPGGPVEFEGKPDRKAIGEFCSVTPGYFSAMGIPLIRGRDFTEHDKEGAPPVAIIDEQLARKVFGNEDPLGKRIKFAVITDRTPWIEIVGVVGHIRSESLEIDPRLQVYWPVGNAAKSRAGNSSGQDPRAAGIIYLRRGGTDSKRKSGSAGLRRPLYERLGRSEPPIAKSADRIGNAIWWIVAAAGVPGIVRGGVLRRATAFEGVRHPHGARRSSQRYSPDRDRTRVAALDIWFGDWIGPGLDDGSRAEDSIVWSGKRRRDCADGCVGSVLSTRGRKPLRARSLPRSTGR